MPPQPAPHERRWARYKIDVRLKVSFPAGGGTGPVFGRGNTLSQGGMGAFIPCSIAIGARVLVEVTFPYSSTEVKLEAVVRSCEGFRYGLEFMDVRDQARQIIVKNCGAAPHLQ